MQTKKPELRGSGLLSCCETDVYWHPVKARFGVMATLAKGPVPVSASGGLEFTSDAEQVLLVTPSTA